MSCIAVTALKDCGQVRLPDSWDFFFFNYLVLRLWIHILKILTFSKENLSSFVKTNPIINWDSENKLS